MKRSLLITLLLLVALPALARSTGSSLTSGQRAQVRQQIRANAQWHFALFEGRRPTLRTVIRPVRGVKDQFTAFAEVTAIWRGARAPLAENLFAITRQPNGKVTVSSQHPFIPK
jgi:hypothetical protein